ncbi:phosphotransferase [Carnobacterium divergens]|uniref:Phosphotransferase n=1 Tax=Carnobacterium divergens TaxID=2748 RepID=A0AAW8RCD3_CARDV|nr:phosphotransferase [Carnobacterium divergens]MDT1958799.1 phosphotransferase [Carnobacterium divergens]MDT1974767.1 phosphotransferase [Carnobacterium divergens]
MDKVIIKKIAQQLNLGMILSPPEQLHGGLMHKMYSLVTEKGKYAIKLLNPYIMKRETAMANFQAAEQLEKLVEQYPIPILPAITFNGQKMQEIDGQFFYLYEWYEGASLKNEVITITHCREIGKTLAKIHQINRKKVPFKRNEIQIDWDTYIAKMAFQDESLYELLKQNRSLLYESQEIGNQAIKKIPPILSICHNDMDSKNVLWHGFDYRIIDLETLSYSSPFIELYEVALCWSGYEICKIDYHLFRAVIQSYHEAGGQLPTDWSIIFDSNYGRLEWLEFNIKRALGIDCSIEEKEIGLSEVRETVAHIVYYHEVRESLLNCLEEFNN